MIHLTGIFTVIYYEHNPWKIPWFSIPSWIPALLPQVPECTVTASGSPWSQRVPLSSQGKTVSWWRPPHWEVCLSYHAHPRCGPYLYTRDSELKIKRKFASWHKMIIFCGPLNNKYSVIDLPVETAMLLICFGFF